LTRCRSAESRPAGWSAWDSAGPGHPAPEQVRGRPALPHRLAGYRTADRRAACQPLPRFPGPEPTAGGRAQAGTPSGRSHGAARRRARTKRPAAGWRAAWARLTPPAPSQSVMAGDPGTARADSPRSLIISAGM
jgi:hypothetical protein